MAAKPFEIDSKPSGSLVQIARVADIGITQALALRKRVLMDALKKSESLAVGIYQFVAGGLERVDGAAQKRADVMRPATEILQRGDDDLFEIRDVAVRFHGQTGPIHREQVQGRADSPPGALENQGRR